MAEEYYNIKIKGLEVVRSMRKIGITISVVMIILGICLFIKPVATSAVMIWLLVIGVLIDGIQKIVTYCRMPARGRDGFLLASGILLVLTSLILIGYGANYEYATTASLEVCAAFMIAFTCIFTGIGRICGSEYVWLLGGSKGLAILAGVLDIICGIIIMCEPLFGLFTMTIIFGLYLTISGIALFIRFISLY